MKAVYHFTLYVIILLLLSVVFYTVTRTKQLQKENEQLTLRLDSVIGVKCLLEKQVLDLQKDKKKDKPFRYF